MLFGLARKLQHARRQLTQHALARNRLVARIQRRELDRNARAVRQPRVAAAFADRTDRPCVALEIALGIVSRARTLAEHVVGVAEFAVVPGARQRFPDRLPEHEMRAQEAHRLPRRGAQRRQAEPLADTFENVLGRLARLNDARRNAERPRRGGDEQRTRFRLVMAPVTGGELVLDQPVGGRGVGHAQQRLRQHHQREALAGR